MFWALNGSIWGIYLWWEPNSALCKDRKSRILPKKKKKKIAMPLIKTENFFRTESLFKISFSNDPYLNTWTCSFFMFLIQNWCPAIISITVLNIEKTRFRQCSDLYLSDLSFKAVLTHPGQSFKHHSCQAFLLLQVLGPA